MIHVHRLNGHGVIVNAELIEWVETHGVETVVGMATGNRIVVKESVAEVVDKIVEYRRSVYVGAVYLPEFLREGSTQQPVSSLRKAG